MTRILIIDDDPQVCETIESLVERHGYEALSAYTLGEGLATLAAGNIDVVFLDVRLPDGNGLEQLPHVKSSPGSPEVIILTGEGDADGAELAIQGGVWDYLLKPSPIKEITLALSRAVKYREEKHAADGKVALNLEHVIGSSAVIRNCFDLVAQASQAHSNVLITGETGTGKELFARTIHENSGRSKGEFVVVDCASLSETLVESTLFGHKKGAFTGADRDRTGLVKIADHGTLLLDEVGEMPLSLQKSFLRVLQERRFRPVGETRELRSDFRLISATNRDLSKMVEQGGFRSDLLFRLKTIHIHLPPLRERKEDIKALAIFFVKRLCERYDTSFKGFGSEFFHVLSSYEWPGNIRELANVLEQAFMASGTESTLYAMHLPSELRILVAKAQIDKRTENAQNENTSTPISHEPTHGFSRPGAYLGDGPPPSLKEFKTLAEKQYLQTLVERFSGDLKGLLEASGLSRSHFYALAKKHDISL